jgi:phospholipase/carboxylesterase
MRAWFDIFSLDKAQPVDQEGIAHTVEYVNELILTELKRGISAHHILLGGFSQGAAIALIAGLRYPETLGGIFALSGFFPEADSVLAACDDKKKKTPIFIAHGTEDAVIPYSVGLITAEKLKQANEAVTFKSYRMAHSVCPEEIRDIAAWMMSLIDH